VPEIDFTNLPDSEASRVDFSSLPDQPARRGVTRSFADEATFREIKNATNGNIEKRARNASTIAATHDISESEAYELQDIFTDLYGDKDLWDKAAGSFKAGWGDMYSSVGGIMKRKGIGEFADTYIDFGERLKRAYIPPDDQSEFTWRKMMDPEWYATTATRSVPFAISLVPAAVVGAYLGVQGATLYGLGLFGQTVLGAIGGAALSRPIESAIEAQGAFEEATQKGFTPEDAESAADQVFWDNMKLSGLDAAEFATAFLPMGKVAGATVKRMLARRIAATTGKLGAVGTMEAAEERYQEKAVMDAVGDFTSFFDFGNPRLNEASAAGAVFGVGLGGAGSVFTALKNNVTKGLPDEVKTIYDTARNEALNAGADPKAADLAGLDAVAGTPEGKAHIEKVLSNIKSIAAGEEIQTVEGEEAFKIDLNLGETVEIDEAQLDTLIDSLVSEEVSDTALDDFINTSIKVLNNEHGSITLFPMTSRKGTGDIPPKTTQQPEGGIIPDNSVMRVSIHNRGVNYHLGSGEAYLDRAGRVILDGETYNIGDKAYLHEGKFHKTPPKGLIDALTRQAEQATGVIDGIKSVMWKIKWDKPKTVKRIEEDWLSGDMIEQDVPNPERYPDLDMDDFYTRDSVSLAEKYMNLPDESKIIPGMVKDKLNDVSSPLFEVGGKLHITDGPKQLSKEQRQALIGYENAGGSLGHSALVSIGRGAESRQIIPGLSDKDVTLKKTIQIVKKDTGLPNPSRPPEVGGQSVPATSILDKVKSINDSLGEKGSIDLEPLVDLGKSIWSEGHTTIEAFTTRAKELLSTSWEKVKDFISQAWEAVKSFNEKLGERGSIGGEKKEAIKTTIRKATGQRTDANMVREDVALREGLRKSAQAARVAMRAGNTEGVAKEKARMKALLIDAKKRAQEREAVKGIKKDIERVAKMKGDIAVDYQKQINAIISGFDFKKPTEQKVTELRSLRAFIEKNGVPLGINQKYLNELSRLEKIPLKELTTDDLTSLRDTLKHLEKLGKLKASMKYKYNQRRIKEALGKLIEWTHNLDPKVKNLKDKSGRDRLRLALKQAYLVTLHSPRVAEMIDGYKQGENVRLIKWLSREETKATQEATKKKEAFMADLRSLGIEHITEAMEARMMAVMREREGARTQAETLINHYKLGGVPTLTAQEEAIIGKVKEYINDQKNDLAAVMEEITGEIFPEMETYYLPMKYEREEQLIPDSNVLGGSRTTHTFDGFRHARVQGVKKVPRIDLVNIFSEAIDEQFWYVRMQPIIEDIKQLVLSEEYEEAAGEMVRDWWRDELDIISRRGWSNSAKNTLMSAGLRQVRHNLNQSILLFKLSTILLQPFAVFDAVAYTNAKYGPEAAAKVFAETTKCVFIPGLAKKYIAGSAELQMRQGGELAMQEEMVALGIKEDDTLMDKASRVGYSMIRRADVNTAAGVQKAIEKMLTERGIADAKTEAEFIMNLTNGSSTIVQRPHILSTGEVARTWFTFQSFIMNRWGIIAHDLIMSGFVKSETYKEKMLTLVSLGILMMAGNLEDEGRKLLVKLTTGREWKDKNRGAFADGVLNLTSTMPVFGSFINAAAMGMSASPPAMRAGENLTKGLYRLYAGKDTESKVKGAVQTTEAGLELFVGLPGTAQAFDLLEAAMFDNK
jgi:hypothetical protein